MRFNLLYFLIIFFAFLLPEDAFAAEETEPDPETEDRAPNFETVNDGFDHNVGDLLFSTLKNGDFSPKNKEQVGELFDKNIQILDKIKQLSAKKNTNQISSSVSTAPYINEKYLVKPEEENTETSEEEKKEETAEKEGENAENPENTSENTEMEGEKKEEGSDDEKKEEETESSEQEKENEEEKSEDSEKQSDEETKEEEALEILGDSSINETLEDIKSDDGKSEEEENEERINVQEEITDEDMEGVDGVFLRNWRRLGNGRVIQRNIVRNRVINSGNSFRPIEMSNGGFFGESLRNFNNGTKNLNRSISTINDVSEILNGDISVKKVGKLVRKNLDADVNELEEPAENISGASEAGRKGTSSKSDNVSQESIDDATDEDTNFEENGESVGDEEEELAETENSTVQQSQRSDKSSQNRRSQSTNSNNSQDRSSDPEESDVSETREEAQGNESDGAENADQYEADNSDSVGDTMTDRVSKKPQKGNKRNRNGNPARGNVRGNKGSNRQNTKKSNSKKFSGTDAIAQTQETGIARSLDMENATGDTSGVNATGTTSPTQIWSDEIPATAKTASSNKSASDFISVGRGNSRVFDDFATPQNSDASTASSATKKLSSKDF